MQKKIRIQLFLGGLFTILLLLFGILDLRNPLGILNRFLAKGDSEIGFVSSFSLIAFVSLLFLFFLSFILAFIALFTGQNKEKYQMFSYNFINVFNIIPFFLFLFLFVDAFFFSPVTVSGSSMEYTYKNGDMLLTSHFNGNKIEIDDVIILKIESDSKLIIKRVKAKEGDKVSFYEEDGHAMLKINDQVLDTGSAFGHGYSYFAEYILKEGELFVLGDHKTNSLDSRTRGVMKISGSSKNAAYCGKVVFSLKPFGKIPLEKDKID